MRSLLLVVFILTLTSASRAQALQTDRSELFTNPDTLARFSGGEKELRKYLRRVLICPDSLQGFKGEVLTTFVIDEKGQTGDVRVISPPRPGAGKKAEEIILAMPPWIPARHRGNTVRSLYVLPLMFDCR